MHIIHVTAIITLCGTDDFVTRFYVCPELMPVFPLVFPNKLYRVPLEGNLSVTIDKCVTRYDHIFRVVVSYIGNC